MAKKSAAPSISIGISDKDRAAIVAGLSKLLAETYTLYLTTHNFHWNVTGPMFNTLHTMFICLLYTSPSPRDYAASRMPSSA